MWIYYNAAQNRFLFILYIFILICLHVFIYFICFFSLLFYCSSASCRKMYLKLWFMYLYP